MDDTNGTSMDNTYAKDANKLRANIVAAFEEEVKNAVKQQLQTYSKRT